MLSFFAAKTQNSIQRTPGYSEHIFVSAIDRFDCILFGKYRELPPSDQLDLKAIRLNIPTLLTLILCQRSQTIFNQTLIEIY